MLQFWKQARQGSSEALEDLAHERVLYFKDQIQAKGLRTFKLILSYSQAFSDLEYAQALNDILSLNNLFRQRLDFPIEIPPNLQRNLEKFRRLYANNDPNWVYWDPKYYDLVINTFDHNAEESLKIALEAINS